MKQLFIALLGGCCVLLLPACKKQSDATPDKTVTVNLKTGENYTMDLGLVGDEEGGSITRQAGHYAVSEVNRHIPTGRLQYVYQPASGYTGADQADVTVARGSDGASANTNIQVYHFIFTVAN